MTTVILFLLTSVAVALVLLVLRVVAGDGATTASGKARRRPADCLPRSHYRDPFEPRPLT